MPKKMLINALHPEESRVAIVDENGQLVDLDIEITGSEQQRGNIYKGVVLRVEPALQAAFIDIGLKKPGFLQMGELHPDNWQWRDDIPEEQRKRRPRIQEVLRRGQELLVQVEKDERDMKGAAVTSYISIPGRYMVIMPGSDSSGISRKVEGEGERKKLKEMVKEMTIPEGVGYIIRTEAVGRTLEELQRDLDSLVANYNDIVARGKETRGPAIIYKEYAVVIRTIRDYFSADIDEVLVDSKEVHKEARAFFKETMPAMEKRVKMHQEKRPIFSRYQIEEQIDQIYEKKVPLRSGGSLVIEPTEALVSIDVNSGKSTGERGVEDTAFRTNLEAVEEAARQLRLRDLGGLIVLDLIDMREMKHVKEVEKALKSALKSDKARVTVGRISQFGMLEMSRQRIKQTLEQGSILDCPHCSGRGKVKGVENMAISFLRKVHAAAAKGNAAEVHGSLPLDVAYYLLNRKKRDLAQIENDYDIEVTIKGKPSFLMNQLELEVIKREKIAELQRPEEKTAWEKGAKGKSAKGATLQVEPPAADEPLPEAEPLPAAETLPAAEASVVTAAEEEGAPVAEAPAKKKRSRSKKKPVEPEGEVTTVPREEAVESPLAAAGEAAAVGPAAAEEPLEAADLALPDEQAETGKKKRKRRRRKKAKAADVAAAVATEAEVEEIPAEEPLAEESGSEALAQEESAVDADAAAVRKKKRRRRKRGGAKTVAGEAAEAEGVADEAETVTLPAAAAEPVAEPAAEPAVVLATATTPPKKRDRRKKSAAAVEIVSRTENPLLDNMPAAAAEVKGAAAIEAEAVTLPENVAEPVAALATEPSPPKKRERKKKTVAAVETAALPENPVVEDTPAPAAEIEVAEPSAAVREKPAKRSRAGVKKKAVAAEPVAEAIHDVAAAAAEQTEELPEKPKAKRAPRRKKVKEEEGA